MAIDKLNFNGLGSASGASNIKGALTNVGDRLMAYGANLSEQDLAKQKQQNIEDNQMIQNNKENMAIDKESANQKALLNYHNAATRASTIGTMSDEQNKALGAEFDSLVSKVGADKAGQIISDKAAAFASADAAKLQSSPKLAYERVSQLELPSGYNIDPLKLIAMKEQKLGSLQDKQNKLDDQAFKEKEFTAEQKYRQDSLAEQVRSRKAAEARLSQEDKEKKDLVNATKIINSTPQTDSKLIFDPVSGAYVKEVGSGKFDVSFDTKIDTNGETAIGDNTNKLITGMKKLDNGKEEKANSLYNKIVPDEYLNDDKKLLENYNKTKGSTSTGADKIKIKTFSQEDQDKIDSLSNEIASLTTTSSFMNLTGTQGEKKAAEIKKQELQKEMSSIVNKYNKNSSETTSTFDEYKKNLRIDNEKNKSELYKVQKEIDKDYNSVLNNLTKEVGVEKKTLKFADSNDVKSKVFTDQYNKIKELNPKIDDASAVKAALDYATKVSDVQTTVKSTAKTEGEKLEEKKYKAVEEDIKTKSSTVENKRNALLDLQKSLITGKHEPSDKVSNPYSDNGEKVRVDELSSLIKAKLENLDSEDERLSSLRIESLKK